VDGSRWRPAQWLVLALALVPAWKFVESLVRSRPRPVEIADVVAGREVFAPRWAPKDPVNPGDGLGAVFNAPSYADRPSQRGPRGGGPVTKNVTVYGLTNPHPRGLPLSGVVHQHAVRRDLQETLDLVHPALPHQPSLSLSVLTARGRPRPRDVVITQRN